MNNGYNNIPSNNYGINNNDNFNYNNNVNNDNNNNNNDNNGNKGNNALFFGVIVLLIIGAGVILYLLFGDNKAEKNLEEELKKEPTISENKKEEEVPKPQQPTPEEPKPENNQTPQQNNNSNNTQTTKKTTLKCTGTTKNEYGTYTHNYTYSFSSDSKMKKAVLKTTATLNSSGVRYRDSLIQALKDENKKFVKLDGISESVSKKSNGFTYTLTLDATKLSAKQLASMGYRTLNYTGVKMRAKELGLNCS